MLRLAKKNKAVLAAIPSHLTTLSVSWLNNQFKAVAVHRGQIEATWERPGSTEGPEHFDAFIREAVHETGYRGQTVSLVITHPRLAQQLVDLPPIKGKKLQKVIQRQARQQKMFPGEASWASEPCPPGKVAQRVVLHLFPKQMITLLVLGCKRNGLRLATVVPTSAVLQQQFVHLILEKHEVGLLAAETGGSTTLSAGGSDGQVLLARTLPSSWNEDPNHLGLDLNRTALFISQQYSSPINRGLWLFGPGAEDRVEAIQKHVQLPVDVSPVVEDPFYWATEALKLHPERSPNLISRELREQPQRRVFAAAMGVLTVLVVISSLVASAYFLSQARLEAANVRALSRDTTRIQNSRAELESLDRELSRKKQIIRLVLGQRPPPVPAWFLSYLAEAVPPELVVTNLHVIREEDYYRVQLAGTVQHGLPAPAVPPVAEPIDVLKARLTGPPFNLKLKETEDDKTTRAVTTGKLSSIDTSAPGWLSRLAKVVSGKTAPTAAKPVVQDYYLIEGTLRIEGTMR